MAKKQKQKAKQAARKAGKGSALVKKKTIQQQPGGSGKRMLVPKHAKQGKSHKPVARPVSSEKLALKARRREEQAARERAKAAEYAAERGQLPPPDVTIKPASFAVDAPPPRDEGDLRWLFAMDHERDAKRAALSAVIFGSNFGANTACIGSLGGLMMRRLALQQGVTVTNGMLLRQGIPVMIPTMLVACYVLVHQTSI